MFVLLCRKIASQINSPISALLKAELLAFCFSGKCWSLCQSLQRIWVATPSLHLLLVMLVSCRKYTSWSLKYIIFFLRMRYGMSACTDKFAKYLHNYQSTASEILRTALWNIFMKFVLYLQTASQVSAFSQQAGAFHDTCCFLLHCPISTSFWTSFLKRIFNLICYVPLFFHSLAKYEIKVLVLTKIHVSRREAKPNSEGSMNERMDFLFEQSQRHLLKPSNLTRVYPEVSIIQTKGFKNVGFL